MREGLAAMIDYDDFPIGEDALARHGLSPRIDKKQQRAIESCGFVGSTT